MVRTRGLGRQAINALSITNSILPGRQSVEELEKSHAETNIIQHTTKPMVTVEILSDLFNAESTCLPETGTEIQGCVCVEEGWGCGGGGRAYIHCLQHHPEYFCIVTDSGVSHLKVSFVQ